ncbi:MAG: hypothetical protein IH608_10345, partial [Proteobacteria bacterium]|nr:hypothetical protein [Pseudomonadota bacterium]
MAPMTNTGSGFSSAGNDRRDFETLIFDLSARFVQLRGDEVDSDITEALGRLLAFFRVDRCGLLRVHHDRGMANVSHAAYGEGVERVPPELNLASLFPWSYERLVELGENVVIRNPGEWPAAAQVDRQ